MEKTRKMIKKLLAVFGCFVCIVAFLPAGHEKIQAATQKSLFPYCDKSGSAGWKDINGKIVVKPKYDEVWEFNEGRAVVVKNNRAGVIDAAGNEIIKPGKYLAVSQVASNQYSEGLLKLYKTNEQIVYVDKNGKEKIKLDASYDEADDFHEGYAEIIKNDGSAYVINKTGKIVYKLPRKLYLTPYGYQEKMAMFQNSKGKYGFFNTKGKEVVKAVYDEAGNFHNGLAVVCKNGKYGYINKQGQVVIKLQYDSAADFSEGMACVSKNGKYGFIDKKGNVVIKLQYQFAKSFREGKVPVCQNGKYGYVNAKGIYVIQPQYSSADSFSEGLAAVVVKNKYGYIDQSGKIVIQPQYGSAGEFCNGAAAVEIYGENVTKWGYVNKKGKEICMTKNDY